MAEFAYNHAKNLNTGHISFELNYKYHFYVFYKKDIDSSSKSKSVNKLLAELRNFMAAYQNTSITSSLLIIRLRLSMSL